MKGVLIGAFKNKWRGRLVRIYEDTDNPTMVYTTGVPLNPMIGPEVGDPEVIETHEPRALFTPYIGSFTKVYD